MTKKKTKEEKIKSTYRLKNFKVQVAEVQARKDVEEFSYLSKDYVRKDLSKTAFFSLIVIILLLVAKKYLG